tara:strand:+ start:2890 stop:3342 length:453 start_codon:yes stop_codon:yes gene_type:complete
MSIQKRLNELKPYVKGIRFAQELPVVDAVFNEKWSVTDTEGVKYNPSKKTAGYFMFYGENETVTFDDILDHVKTIIDTNIEIEKKRELLKSKVRDLQVFFENHTYEQLSTLKYSIDEVDTLVEETKPEPKVRKTIKKEEKNEKLTEEVVE